jgi:hypothetical protein
MTEIAEQLPSDIDLDMVEKLMFQVNAEQRVKTEEAHHFADGIYVREMRAPAGAMILGHRHTTRHVNFLMAGEVVAIVDGEYRTITAPAFWISEPGRKMCVVVRDVIWINVHPNAENETDIARLAELFIKKTSVFLENSEKKEELQ